MVGTATLNDGALNITGGTIRFIGAIRFGGEETSSINVNLTGHATVTLGGGEGTGVSTTINGSAGSGLTSDLSAIQPVLILDIMHPSAFHGLLDFANNTPGQAGSGSVLKNRVHATSAQFT